MCRIVLFLMTFLLICPLTSSSQQNIIPPDKNQKKLAGHAIFPDKQYKEWLKVQSNPGTDPASKIKCTIDTFLTLKYESLKKGTLFDFGFLFNLSDERGEHQYANERGSLLLRIVGWRALGNLIEHYDYRPRYKDINIRGKLATVSMYSSDSIVHTDTPDRFHRFGWGTYTLFLEKVNSKWLIRQLNSQDETYTMYPRDTNFHKKAQKTLENNKTYKEFEAPPEVMRMIKEQTTQQYSKIAGDYVFDQDRGKEIISFGVLNGELIAKFEELDFGIQLFPFKRIDLAFSAIAPNGNIYDLQFIKDNLGNVTKCEIKILEKKNTGIKTKHGSNLDESINIFPGYNRAYFAQLKAERERMGKDPWLEDFYKNRLKKSQEDLDRKIQEGEKKIQVYCKISGRYRFDIEGKPVLISFYGRDYNLMGKYEDNPEIPLFQVNDNPLEFEWRPESPYDKIYKLRFVLDQAEKIIKCVIQVEGQSYEGIKLEGPCYLY